MSSIFNPFSGNILKSFSASDTLDLKSSNLIKAVVEKNLSKFEYLFKTNFGKLSVFSDQSFSKGDFLKINASLVKNTPLMIFDEKGSPLNFKASPEFMDSVKSLGQTTININASMEKVLSFPKFLVSTEFGNIEVESDVFLSKGDILKLDPKDVKNFLLSKETKAFENLKTSIFSKLPSREILKILEKNPEKAILDFIRSAAKIDSKENLKALEKIFDNLVKPLNNESQEIKASVKYFLGSSFESFQNDLESLKENLLKLKNENPLYKFEDLNDAIEKTDRFLESMSDQKSLNSLRFADSSRMYFFLPFQGKESGFGEFFIDRDSKNKNGTKELRAVVRLDMSRLGLLMADLRLFEKNLNVSFGVESFESKKIIESGFDTFRNNLKKTGFNEVFLYCSVVEEKKIRESLIKDFLKNKDENQNSTLSIIA
jgi:hypothetical protein